MKNNYEAPEVFAISTAGSFVLGLKALVLYSIDAVLGWGWWTFEWTSDLDEGEN